MDAYYTGDGSAGLYSYEDNDVYHSYFGALTEAYEKFVLPAFNTSAVNKTDIKLLDLCYGIGYNTKSFLNYFFKLKQNEIKKISERKKIFLKEEKFFSKNEKFLTQDFLYNETIYTDNNFGENSVHEAEENKNSEKIFSDISHENNFKNISGDDLSKNLPQKIKIKIDAVDLNDELLFLSPFFKTENFYPRKKIIEINKKIKAKNELKNKIDNIKYSNINKDYKISPLICTKLYNIIKNDSYFTKKERINKYKKTILKNSEFFDQFLIDLSKKYQKWGYKNTFWFKISALLHNIYYRYITKRYKKGCLTSDFGYVFENLGDFCHIYNIFNQFLDINVSFYTEDARTMVKNSSEVYDIIFLDAFTPAIEPALWTVDFFKLLYEHLSDDGIIITYSNSAAIRKAFSEAGFFIGKTFDSNNKTSGTVASKNSDNIKYKLDDKELGLLNTKAGIPFRDPELNSDNSDIIKNRKIEYNNSMLKTSSQYFKELKNEI